MNERSIAKALQIVAEREMAAKAARKVAQRQQIADLNGKLTLASTGLTLVVTGGGALASYLQNRKVNALLTPQVQVREMTVQEQMADDRNMAVQEVLAERSARKAARLAKKTARSAAATAEYQAAIQRNLRKSEEAYAEAMKIRAEVITLHQTV